MLHKINIDRNRPVVVFASYRTGSTALCDYVGKKYQLSNFDEAFHPAIPWKTVDFLTYALIKPNNRFIIKVMPDHYQNYKSLLDFLINKWDCTLVRLTRQSFVEQVASWYVATETGVWHNDNSADDQYVIPVDQTQIKSCVDFLNKQNKDLLDLNFKFDIELDYDSLGLVNSKYQIYNKPTNYSTLIEEIKKIL